MHAWYVESRGETPETALARMFVGTWDPVKISTSGEIMAHRVLEMGSLAKTHAKMYRTGKYLPSVAASVQVGKLPQKPRVDVCQAECPSGARIESHDYQSCVGQVTPIRGVGWWIRREWRCSPERRRHLSSQLFFGSVQVIKWSAQRL